MKVEILNEKLNFKENLSDLINRIFTVCKTDPHFKFKSEIKKVEENVKSIKGKVKRQDNLLEQSTRLTDDVSKRILSIKEDNESKQIELLESLGSEL